MPGGYHSVAPEQLPELLADRLAARLPDGHAARVAVDGPDCARPGELAAAVLEPLRRRGHQAHHVPSELFWRDASLRLEYGREDLDSYRQWLDLAALRREVLAPLGPGGEGRFLPSLRDPATNRSTRAARLAAGPGDVVIVSGGMLLDRLAAGPPDVRPDGPGFDLTIHLAVSPAARARRTAAELHWTLPAFDDYDRSARPQGRAAVVVRLDDPKHPALRFADGPGGAGGPGEVVRTSN